MNSMKVSEKICIEPRFFSQNLKEKITEKLNGKLCNNCNQKYGYITSIHDLEIVDNEILDDGQVAFEVHFLVDTVKPSPGDMFEGKVCMLFDNGVFINVQDKFNVLIPINVLEGYKYDKMNNCFKSNKKKGKSICENDTLSVKINNVQFSDQKFSCLGELTE